MGQLILIGIGIFLLIGFIAALADSKSGEGCGFLILVLIALGIGFMFSPLAAFVVIALILFFAGNG